MAKSFVSDYVLPHKSPMEKFQRDHSKLPDNPSQISRESYVLRGWLNVEQTDALVTLLEEDDCNLQAVLLAAGLLALARAIEFQREQEDMKLKGQPQNSTNSTYYPSLNDMIHTNIRYFTVKFFTISKQISIMWMPKLKNNAKSDTFLIEQLMQ